MTTIRLVIAGGIICLLAGCAEELPPRSVDEFLGNRILLEATMVRCGENRNESKYEAECVNAREAINRIAAVEERARREDIEAQFERKRRSLRRTQEAAAEARRRAAEARRLQEEAEYLGIYETVPAGDAGVISTAGTQSPQAGATGDASLEGNQPGVTISPPAPEVQDLPTTEASDIDSIREELRKRQDTSG